MKQKGSAVLILVAVVALIVIAVTSYLSFVPKRTVPEEDLSLKVATTTDVNIAMPSSMTATPKAASAPVTKWQTYENKTYKFKFSYPSGWMIGSNIFDGRGELFALSICPPELTENGDCKYKRSDKEHFETFAP